MMCVSTLYSGKKTDNKPNLVILGEKAYIISTDAYTGATTLD